MTLLLQQFNHYLYSICYNKAFQKSILSMVQEFIRQQHITDITSINQQQVKTFFDYLHIRPLQLRSGALSEATIYNYVDALKTLFSWLETTKQIDYNPISGITFKRPKRNIRQPLTTHQITQLFTVATTLQQTAILHLFYSCGLRRSEAQALNINDIHFKEQLVYIRAGKGNKRRVIPITAKVTTDLKNYYLYERSNKITRKEIDPTPFILNLHSTRMRGQTFIQLLQQLTKKAGLPKEITLHHLRHSIATHLLQSGMSIQYVSDFLGHTCLQTTTIYAKTVSLPPL